MGSVPTTGLGEKYSGGVALPFLFVGFVLFPRDRER
jgi:hypothetical protein